MPNFKDIEKRLHILLGASDDATISKALGYRTTKAYNAIKTRQAIPYEKLLNFSVKHGIDSISLIYGDRTGKEIINRTQLGEYNEKDYYVIPYFSEVRAACGTGCINDSTYQQLLLLPKSRYSLPKDIEAIKSFGDSMYPLVKNDSIIIFKRVDGLTDIKNSCIYIFRYEEELFMKMLMKNLDNPKKVKSISLNQTYPIQDLDAENIQIVGEFVSTI